MRAILDNLWRQTFPPVPESISDEFAVLSATRLQIQSRWLSLAMFLTIPMVLYASMPGTSPMIRFGVPIAVGSSCLICFLALIKDRNASGSAELARKFITESAVFSATICVLVSIWCLNSWFNAPPEMKLFYPFTLAMGSLTTIYCLSTVRWAAILNIVIGIIPITALLLLTADRVYMSAAASLTMVTIFLFRMITQQNNQFIKLLLLRREMQDLANTDPLTGLHNRRALSEFLEQEIATNKSEGGFAIALMDLDGFKPVNDQYGHAIGDKLLIEIAGRLRSACGDEAIVARMGGDEFAILVRHGSSLESATIADYALAALAPPCHIDGHVIRVGASVGVAEWPNDGNTQEALFETADRALYAAKAEVSGQHDTVRRKNRSDPKKAT
ncbi:GGDEF domain-containing protein [Parasphingorhabdus halotolerans]|uniref:Diguanylate cyclase n=1 Tax=Parasphingorhabdus halotolerans TaxID=2725558 RepID=A0A6H2DP03_9SPHN|nr:diguanylate cyclase [Parasphingorhabdus halotolerans]QJB70084.1 diguanylate cyclase [Parasphingorhabdus halotolerans]